MINEENTRVGKTMGSKSRSEVKVADKYVRHIATEEEEEE